MNKAFTLIELLIVVAIIAILAAIAVPNFLEAQTRAKVSRVKADMRSQDTAITAYQVDNNAVPNCNNRGSAVADSIAPIDTNANVPILERISTPVAYITNALTRDPFKFSKRFQSSTAQGMQGEVPATLIPGVDAAHKQNSYIYQAWNSDQRYTVPADSFSDATKNTKAFSWLLHSAGPDATYYNLGGVLANDDASQLQYTIDLIYDATNGSVSRGSIWRCGGQVSSSAVSGTYKAGAGLVAAIEKQK